VIGSAAPAAGGELGGTGGAVSQGDEGDDDAGGVQFLTGAPSTASTAFGAAPLAAELAVAPAVEATWALSAVDAGSAVSAGDIDPGGPLPAAGMQGPSGDEPMGPPPDGAGED